MFKMMFVDLNENIYQPMTTTVITFIEKQKDWEDEGIVGNWELEEQRPLFSVTKSEAHKR
jgi:hypothetical protein